MKSLLGDNEVLVAQDVLTVDERSVLLGWLQERHNSGELIRNPKDPNVLSTPFRSADGSLTPLTCAKDDSVVWLPEQHERFSAAPPPLFWEIRTRVISILGIEAFADDPYKGSFLTYVLPGGQIHEHRDSRVSIAQRPFAILRCNVMLACTDDGAFPVIDGQQLEVPELAMWAFFPTELVHSTKMIEGIHRATLSYGFIVDPIEFMKRPFRVRQSIKWPDIPRDEHSPVADIVRFVSRQTDWFTTSEVARAAGQPPTLAADVLRELQRQRVIESSSSLVAANQNVVIL